MKNYPILAQLDPDAFEPSWVFSAAEVYVDMDLGSLSEKDIDSPQKFRRPWFKMNQPISSNASLRLYKRPYFHIAED